MAFSRAKRPGVSASLVRSSLDGVNDQSGGLGDARGEWYFCFKHNKVEMRHECKRVDRMGPYPTPEDAENWRARSSPQCFLGSSGEGRITARRRIADALATGFPSAWRW